MEMKVFHPIALDHESLRGVLDALSAPAQAFRKRAIFRRALPLFQAHACGMEHSLMKEGLGHEATRPLALKCIEENELAEIAVRRMSVANHDDIWEARLKVFCQILGRHLREAERIIPLLEEALPEQERKELAMRYLETRNKLNPVPPTVREAPVKPGFLYDQAGRVGYLIAWLLGVPAWLLLVIFLIRGH